MVLVNEFSNKNVIFRARENLNSPFKCRCISAHLAPFLFVSSKELANLIHETRVLLLPPEPEGALP